MKCAWCGRAPCMACPSSLATTSAGGGGANPCPAEFTPAAGVQLVLPATNGNYSYAVNPLGV